MNPKQHDTSSNDSNNARRDQDTQNNPRQGAPGTGRIANDDAARKPSNRPAGAPNADTDDEDVDDGETRQASKRTSD